MVLFFFFKQKTAYEMRISDWSSDVCSSDLRAIDRRYESQRRSKVATTDYIGFIEKIIGEERRIDSEIADVEDTSADIEGRIVAHLHRRIRRSEEHTSELQSLIRHSYALFCYKQKHSHLMHATKNQHINVRKQ